MTKPRIALVIGIICISIFPILVKLKLSPPIISAFYRMAIAAAVLVPFALFSGKLKVPNMRLLLLTVLCGFIFALDVTVWNIAIQESTATQATLLTNLSPVWVGVGAFFFLKNKPTINFWIGTVVAIFGMITLVGFHFFLELDFNFRDSFRYFLCCLYVGKQVCALRYGSVAVYHHKYLVFRHFPRCI